MSALLLEAITNMHASNILLYPFTILLYHILNTFHQPIHTDNNFYVGDYNTSSDFVKK